MNQCLLTVLFQRIDPADQWLFLLDDAFQRFHVKCDKNGTFALAYLQHLLIDLIQFVQCCCKFLPHILPPSPLSGFLSKTRVKQAAGNVLCFYAIAAICHLLTEC